MRRSTSKWPTRTCRETRSPLRRCCTVKGTQLRAKEVSKDAKHAINLVADNMERQVKRHRDKRRGRRDSRSAAEAARMGDVARRGSRRAACNNGPNQGALDR